MNTASPFILLFAHLSAIALHEFILRRVEVDRHTLSGIFIFTAVFYLTTQTVGIYDSTVFWATFWGTLSIWILVYRAFWHPLRRFPGPFAAKLSKWWATKQIWGSGFHFHRIEQKLHEKYGDYVRTGPRELSITDPLAIQPLLGFASKVTKGPFYDALEKTLHMNRDKPFHKQRRRIWDNAMKESMSDFAPRVEEFTDQLLNRLRQDKGRPVSLMQYCNYYSYDVMSFLAFGKPMGFIRGEQSESATSIVNAMSDGLGAMSLMSHVPWLMNALGVIISLAGPMKQWKVWSVRTMKERLALQNPKPDFAGRLIAKTPETPEGLELLYGESRLIITAGSETTSTALTLAFMQLATHPEYMRAIREEYRSNEATYHCERSLPLLDAVIHESMRLTPSIFLASQRVTPPDGLQIGSIFIPGNTIVQMSSFAMYRDPRNFVQPNEFIPERWTTRPELMLNKNVFNPFSVGPYNCVGKPLAYMELRSVIARVVNEFDVRLPDDFAAERYWESVTSRLTAVPPEQMVRFVKSEINLH